MTFGSWVTLMVFVIPPPFMVMVAEREVVPVFAMTFTVIVASLEPEVLLTVHHDWLLLTVQELLEVMVKVWLLAVLVKDRLLLFTVSVAEDPTWETLISRVIPPPFMVMVAERGVVPVFAVTFTLIDAWTEPEVMLTVHHDWLLLAVQEMLEVRVKVLLLAVLVKEKLLLSTVNVTGAAF